MSETKTETWQDRVEREAVELDTKVTKLGEFLDRVEAGMQELDPVTRQLLVAQHGAMTAYLGILVVRMNTRVERVEA